MSRTESDRRVERLFASDGTLFSRKPGYVRRGQQVALAHRVAGAFNSAGILLADAPTGTGKSLAYLAPAALAGEKVIVSTATIALQHQLLEKDIPPLRKAVSEQLGYPEDEGFSYAVMKGRRNFLCIQRHQETLRAGSIFDEGVVRNLDLWASETATGDREDLYFPVPAGTWAEIASDGEDCAPAGCPFREGCFYYAHRDRAAEADIIVVNHALLLANAATGGAIFDLEGRHLVIDEAHRLENVMAEAFGARVSYGRVLYAMRQAKKKSVGATDAADGAALAAERFFESLQNNPELGGRSGAPGGYGSLTEALGSVKRSLANDPREEANNLAGMVGRLKSDLESFYAPQEESHAYSVTAGRSRVRSRKPYPELRSWLVDTEAAFREVVLPMFNGRGVVLASATLANGRGSGEGPGGATFSYARGRLGLGDGPLVPVPAVGKDRRTKATEKKVEEHAGGDIFDYAGRCLIYLADDLPTPGYGEADRFTPAAIRRTEELISLAEGRTLVLLSTKRALDAFREDLDTAEYPVRFQGDDSSGRLVSWLKGSEGGVLVGTRTFWEGIDVPGEAVSLVVMDRVPFPPPNDPVIRKLSEKADLEGRGWFPDVSLPRAQISLRQGAGRLMRRAEDRGVIAILDPRVSRKGWGSSVVRALPDAPTTTLRSEVRVFFG
ncbi:ATP-dependent DNA helicase [Rubrobacter indicoceani]|uniref:ATP-dependent DNA helicase n=1 Tax=Rubrobacter indicoceani TaxID=2051957 RepID=UPI000E5A9827|nr:ATP-dependent DNA helicase [Rubrobacter indicoceani]